MKGATLCSGIGAPECAMPWVDWIWSSEIDPFASAVHALRFPRSVNLGDMTADDFVERAAAVGLPDVLVAGTPCVAFSVAGLRRSLADDRGNLTLRFVRIVDAIDALRRDRGLRPLVVLWENVPGVLSVKDNAFGALLGGLVGDDAPVDLGGRKWPGAGVVAGPARTAAWRTLDAQFFGVAQRRRRVFVLSVGGAGGWAAADALLPVVEGLRWHPAPRREAGEGVAVGALAGTSPGGGWRIGADEAAAGHAVAVLGGDAVVAAWGGNNTSGPIDVATAVNAHGGPHGRLDFETETFVTAFDPKRDLAPHGSVEPRRIASPLTATDHKDPQIVAFNTTGPDAGVVYAAPTVGTLCADTHLGAYSGQDAYTGRLVAFHPTQDPISSADVTHALGTGSKQGCATVAIAFSAKDHGADATADLSPTLRAMPHHGSHANGGGQMAVAVTGDITHALNTANNGKMSSEDGTGRGVPIAAVTHALGLHENQRAEVTLSDTAGALKTGGGKPGQDYPAATIGTAVRRLTPTECERLQGFPEVTKTCIINVWHSSDLHANFASAATPSPRSQKSALSADGNASQSCVSAAGQSSLTPPQDLDLPVALRVRISSGRQEVEILSAGKLIGSAVIAAGQGASLLHTHRDVFVRLAALLTTTAERTTSSGKEASPPYTTPFIVPLNGRKRVNVSGQEIEELASDAGLFTKKASDCLRFTTSQSGPSSQNCDLILTTSSSCVAAATASFIPTETRRASSYAVIVEVVTGWTDVVHRGKPAADGPRYKAIGNSMAVPVLAWIGDRIRTVFQQGDA